jgi:HAD superfamily hydrolase (TIGR01484 family)
LKELSALTKHAIKVVFTDIDGTLTNAGQISNQTYAAIWDLHQAGFSVVPVTGRPAGWCEMIARVWPVHGVIGENGAFIFRYENKKPQGQMHRLYALSEEERQKNRAKLDVIWSEIQKLFPHSQMASDQFCRMFDLAVDICEDVPTLPKADVDTILSLFKKHGATAKLSSIHINGWFGSYDKLSMCRTYCKEFFKTSFEDGTDSWSFIGDSPNDEPMFKGFKNSFAVANINEFKSQIVHWPTYITKLPEGEGFVEFANHLIKTS